MGYYSPETPSLAPPTPEPVKLTGDVKISVSVKVPDSSEVVSQSLDTQWRGANELYSSGEQ